MTIASSFHDGQLWLAPLTRGGHLAFRRLCVEMGADITVSEMVVVKRLLRGKSSEFALLKSHPSEPLFGVQLADRAAETLAEGARLAESRGARFIDLNCGCPIYEITARGLGASLMRKPARLARLVTALVAAVRVPITVKLRTGWSAEKTNVSEVARACEESGASAIEIHGRSREQRYQRAADWDLIGRVAAERSIPVVGNGDILTHYEARQRMRQSGVRSVMLARGALVKPWLFREILESRDWLPTAEERFEVLLRFVSCLRDHFGDDERGRRRALTFLPWHLGFFSRYRPLPEAEFGQAALEHPLIHRRHAFGEDLPPLEGLLRDPREETHAALAALLIEFGSDTGEARERAQRLSRTLTPIAEAARPEANLADVAG